MQGKGNGDFISKCRKSRKIEMNLPPAMDVRLSNIHRKAIDPRKLHKCPPLFGVCQVKIIWN